MKHLRTYEDFDNKIAIKYNSREQRDELLRVLEEYGYYFGRGPGHLSRLPVQFGEDVLHQMYQAIIYVKNNKQLSFDHVSDFEKYNKKHYYLIDMDKDSKEIYNIDYLIQGNNMGLL